MSHSMLYAVTLGAILDEITGHTMECLANIIANDLNMSEIANQLEGIPESAVHLTYTCKHPDYKNILKFRKPGFYRVLY